MKSLIKIIFTGILAISLSACSGTPSCESKEASDWFKNSLSPKLNDFIGTFVKHSPSYYVLDDIETVKHDTQANTYSCKGVLRLHLSSAENKVFAAFDSATAKDPNFPLLVENELMTKGGKDNALFGLTLVGAMAINNASLHQNNENEKDIKYFLDIPVIYSTNTIKSSSGNFQIQSNLTTDAADEFITAHGILLSRITIAKNFFDHPELLEKIKTDNAAKEAKVAKDKQDAITKDEEARIAIIARNEEIAKQREAELELKKEELRIHASEVSKQQDRNFEIRKEAQRIQAIEAENSKQVADANFKQREAEDRAHRQAMDHRLKEINQQNKIDALSTSNKRPREKGQFSQ